MAPKIRTTVFVTLVRVIALAACVGVPATAAVGEPKHGIAMHGEPALPPDFPHLPYANPDAPKGGRIAFANVGTFDSLNPFVVKGTAPRGLRDDTWGNNVWESLLARNRAEPFSLYALLAETVETAPDRSWVEFTIRPEARFSDGAPVTPEDVLFSWELLKTKARPLPYRNSYGKVAKAERVGTNAVRFTFAGADREMPLILGLMPILAKHATDPERFDQGGLQIPVGSGPYRITDVDPGTRFVLRRNPDYWGKDLPLKRGFDNFDEIGIEYFRDVGSFFEAFKKGLFDLNFETDPQRWASGYDFPAARDGRVAMVGVETGVPKNVVGLFMNTRRPLFADPKVREALTYFFDFEWLNQNLFSGRYQRTGSFFQGSELSALGRPVDERERALLAPFPAAVRADVLDGSYAPPASDGSGRDRALLRRGMDLLTAAGFERSSSGLVRKSDGLRLSFEFLARSRDEERLALAFQRSLALVGIEMRVRLVDASQYEARIKDFDYDMVQYAFFSSLSPGNEQLNRWSSRAAEAPGSFNIAGVREPAADAMIAAMLASTTREDFVAAVRALDRVLISGSYVVPLFHAREQWLAVWSRIGMPAKGSLYGAEPTTWWAKQQ